MAEREGFEPSVPLAEHDDLANRCLRPLGHLSKKTTTPTRQIAPYTTKPIPPPSSKICLQRLGKARDRKDATVGAKRLGLHRALCGFAADRARRPPFRALSFFGVSPVAPQGRSVAVEGLALRACTLSSLFSVAVEGLALCACTLCFPGRRSRPFGAIAWKSQGRRDQRERWSPQGFHAKPSSR